MQPMSPGVSDQRRHPGHVDRRSHGRTLTDRHVHGHPGPSATSRAERSRGVKILLIRLRLIGDVVFTTPAVAALRERFPDAHISYLVEPAAEPVVRHNRHLDRVIVAERRRGLRRVLDDVTLAARLRAERFDVVIDFHGGPRSSWLTRASGASRRIGYALPGRWWAYTDALPWTRSLVPPRHS